MMIYLISLIISCKSDPYIKPPEIPIPAVPEKPFTEPPFKDIQNIDIEGKEGFYIETEKAKLLLIYLIELDSYIKKLRLIIDYYQNPGEKNEKNLRE